MRSKDIIGKEVLDTEVHTVGKVIDIEIDPENYTIKSLIVQEGNIQERINIKNSLFMHFCLTVIQILNNHSIHRFLHPDSSFWASCFQSSM